MKRLFLKMTFQLIILTVVVFGLQYFISSSLLVAVIFYIPLIKIYAFHFFITYIIMATLLYVKNIIPDKVGFTFMGFGILKMAFAILFLLPLKEPTCLNPIPDVLAFFIPYFIFLFYETFYLVSLLNKESLHNM